MTPEAASRDRREPEPALDHATGDDLIDRWPPSHPRNRECPECGDPVTTVALIHIAYQFEPCSCSRYDYEHLVETLYHRACLQPPVCTEFRPFRVRGTRSNPTHYTASCHVCGRTERNHDR